LRRAERMLRGEFADLPKKGHLAGRRNKLIQPGKKLNDRGPWLGDRRRAVEYLADDRHDVGK
jgi:hypothetical protein